MADPVTQADIFSLFRDHSDIRLDGANQTADMRRETTADTAQILLEQAKATDNINSDVKQAAMDNIVATKDARYDIASRISDSTAGLISQVDKQYHASESRQFELMRDLSKLQGTADLNRTATVAAVEAAADRTARDAEISVLKNTIEGQKNTQYLSDRIGADGERTRGMLTDFRDRELNRHLIERNTELAEERHHVRGWRDRADQSQFAALSTQLQAFGSQLQETRQGMVNFGTMAGVGQTSSSNNV